MTKSRPIGIAGAGLGVYGNAGPSMTTAGAEIFGPVLAAQFATTDLDEVAALADSRQYGLAARVGTENVRAAHCPIPFIKLGQFGVHGPHGGTADLPVGGDRQSGWRRENGRDGVKAYTDIKSVVVANKRPGDWLAFKE